MGPRDLVPYRRDPRMGCGCHAMMDNYDSGFDGHGFVAPIAARENVVELLETVRTEMCHKRLENARRALISYWTNRHDGNGSPETDSQAHALADAIAEANALLVV